MDFSSWSSHLGVVICIHSDDRIADVVLVVNYDTTGTGRRCWGPLLLVLRPPVGTHANDLCAPGRRLRFVYRGEQLPLLGGGGMRQSGLITFAAFA